MSNSCIKTVKSEKSLHSANPFTAITAEGVLYCACVELFGA